MNTRKPYTTTMDMIHTQMKEDKSPTELKADLRKFQLMAGGTIDCIEKLEAQQVEAKAVADAKLEETIANAEAEIEAMRDEFQAELDASASKSYRLENERNKHDALHKQAAHALIAKDAELTKLKHEYNNSTALTDAVMAQKDAQIESLEAVVQSMKAVYDTAEAMVNAKVKGDYLEGAKKEVSLIELIQGREQRKPVVSDEQKLLHTTTKGSRPVIIGPVHKPPFQPHSHSAGWIDKWLELTGALRIRSFTLEDLQHASEVFIYGGINGAKSAWNTQNFNVDKDEIQGNFNALATFIKEGGKVSQLDEDFKFATNPRKGIEVDPILNTVPVVEQKDFIDPTKGLVIGDSHSISVAPVGWAVIRMDGKTLGGALNARDSEGNKVGLKAYIPEGYTGKILFSFMNIDLRHHVCGSDRTLDEAKAEIKGLIDEYRTQVRSIPNVSYVMEPMAHPDDERKVSNALKHDGQNFKGSREDRDAIYVYTTEELLKGNRVVRYPSIYKVVGNDNELDQVHMESSNSIHLAPKSYLFRVAPQALELING